MSILKEQSEKYCLEILGWCLMTNPIHLIARPSTLESLAKAVGRTHFLYTQNINYLHRPSGHFRQAKRYTE
jgi:putative transposase